MDGGDTVTLTLYLSRVVGSRIVGALAALTSLVLLIEMLEAVRRMPGEIRGFGTVLTYLLLRLPLAMDRLLPLTVLIGCVLAFGTLARRNEMTILRAAGLSPVRFFFALWPVLLVCGIINHVLEDRWAPAAEKTFAVWWQDVTKQGSEPQLQWLRAGDQIISIGGIEAKGQILNVVTRYERDALGRLTLVARAKEAEFVDGTWHLHDEVVSRSGGRQTVADTIWQQGPSVENMRQLTLSLSRVSGTEAQQALKGNWSGTDSAAHYRIVVQRSYAAFIIPSVMMLLAIPALHGNRRAGNLAHGTAGGLGLGLAFLVTNGLFLSMGEATSIPAVLAVWGGPLSFLLIGVGAWLHFEESCR